MSNRTQRLCTGIVATTVALTAPFAAAAANRPPRDEANLVVSRFLVASALRDRTTACSLYPTLQACRGAATVHGAAEFRVTGITLRSAGRAIVAAIVRGSRDRFELERRGASFVIARSSFAGAGTVAPSARSAAASLIVSRFLVAAALGDAHASCALYPSYFPCSRHAPVSGTGNFRIVSVSLAVPDQPAVFANVDGLRGYFVLERHARSYVITQAGLD